MEFLDPKIDTAFKKLFGSEDKKQVTISFLNAILEYAGARRIETTQFLNNKQQAYAEDTKASFCTDLGGRRYIIEMQNA